MGPKAALPRAAARGEGRGDRSYAAPPRLLGTQPPPVTSSPRARLGRGRPAHTHARLRLSLRFRGEGRWHYEEKEAPQGGGLLYPLHATSHRALARSLFSFKQKEMPPSKSAKV